MSKQLWVTAYHEAGHAVARSVLELPPPTMVSIVPAADYAGVVTAGLPRNYRAIVRDIDGQADFDGRPHYRYTVERLIMCYLAGSVAQNCHLNARHSRQGCGDDHRKAFRLAERVTLGDHEARALVAFLTVKTRSRLLRPEPWRRVEALALALVERETMKGEEIQAVYRSASIESAQEWQALEDWLRPRRDW